MIDVQVNSARRELNNLEKFGLLYSGVREDIEKEGSKDKKNKKEIKKDKENEEGSENKEEKEDKKEEKKEVKKARSNKEKYYSIDKKFALFNEIRALIVGAQILYKEDFVESIKKLGHLELLVLTGLFVGVDDSAVDVLVVGDVDKRDLVAVINDLEEKLGREVNFALMDLEEFQYRQQITDVFLYSILEGKKNMSINKLDIV